MNPKEFKPAQIEVDGATDTYVKKLDKAPESRPTVFQVKLNNGVVINWVTFIKWLKAGKIDQSVIDNIVN